MKCLVFVTVFVAVLKNGAVLQLQSIVANTEQGNVLGNERVNRKGESFYSFTSIPYAKPPVGDLRFMVCKTVGIVYFKYTFEKIFNVQKQAQ